IVSPTRLFVAVSLIRTSNLQVSVVCPYNESMYPMPRFPPRGPLGRLFPRFLGTIKALRLPAAHPAAFRFLHLAVPREHASFAPVVATCDNVGPGVGHSV